MVNVTNPCLPIGTNFSHNMSYLFTNHTCTNDIVPNVNYNDSLLINFNGSSNPTECLVLLQKAMNVSKCFNSSSTVVDCSNDLIPSVSEMRFMVCQQ